MAKNHNSVVELRIQMKFWLMIPMGTITQSLSKKLNGGGRERDSQVADLGFKNCSLGPKIAIFGPKKPWKLVKTTNRRGTVGTLRARLDLPVSTSPLRRSHSMICPGNGPKSPQKLQTPTATNQE